MAVKTAQFLVGRVLRENIESLHNLVLFVERSERDEDFPGRVSIVRERFEKSLAAVMDVSGKIILQRGDIEYILLSRSYGKLVRLEKLVTNIESNEIGISKLSKTVPPVGASFLLAFLLPLKQQEEVLGHFDELYGLKLERFRSHPILAKIWYWKQVIWTIWPYVWRAITKIAIAEELWRRFL